MNETVLRSSVWLLTWCVKVPSPFGPCFLLNSLLPLPLPCLHHTWLSLTSVSPCPPPPPPPPNSFLTLAPSLSLSLCQLLGSMGSSPPPRGPNAVISIELLKNTSDGDVDSVDVGDGQIDSPVPDHLTRLSASRSDNKQTNAHIL